ncbi:copper resistance CopC/CopD family protein [Microvirga yunnanensis]|uniref:copper resistance CopC/CopD family protein n=1 Tax=Microvirga yunnanensis TaxID=2953740 RepID=UPI0021CA2C85|nr:MULTISPECIES: CopD family protein [unclassified Microvirga]
MMRAILISLWLTLAALCGSGGVLAHAALVASHPMDGATIEGAPPTVRLHFNEPISPLVVSLTDAAGRTHRDLAVVARNEVLEIAMPPGLARGSHVLSYRVTSGDGHPIGGSIVFAIEAPTRPGAVAGRDASEGTSTAVWLARMGLYLGLFAGVGGTFFLAWIAPGQAVGQTGRGLAAFLAVGLLSAILSLGFQGVDALGEPLASISTPAAWSAGWRTSLGWTAVIGSAALSVGWLGLRGPAGWRRAWSLLALCGIGAALASSGHASAAAPQWLTRPAVFLHAVAVAYWVGALIPLAVIVRKRGSDTYRTVRRFSGWAIGAVAVLFLTGILLAAIQAETFANLTTTAYGRILIAKTLFVMALLGLAALNRLWLTPALSLSAKFGRRWLVRSVAAEFVLCLAILAAVGLWRFTPPPRALAASAAAAASASVHLHSPRVMAQVTLSPGRVGNARASIVIASGSAQPIDAKEVTLVLSKPEAGIEAIIRPARRSARNAWEVYGLTVPVAGTWQARVAILIDDFEQATLEGTIAIRP